MPDNDWDDRWDQPPAESNAVKVLREKAEKDSQRLKDLEEKLNKSLEAQRAMAVRDVLREKQLPVKVANLIPKDVEPTPEAVDKWLESYADVFGFKKNEADAAQGEGRDGAPTDQSVVPGNEQAAYQRMMNASQGGQPATSISDVHNRIMNAATPEELTEILRTARI